MAINYTEQFETRKASSNVAGASDNYRIEYIARNTIGESINNITAIISKVTTEGSGAAQKEILTRVGSASLDKVRNNNYMSFDKFADVTLDDQEAIVTKYFTDVKSILSA